MKMYTVYINKQKIGKRITNCSYTCNSLLKTGAVKEIFWMCRVKEKKFMSVGMPFMENADLACLGARCWRCEIFSEGGYLCCFRHV